MFLALPDRRYSPCESKPFASMAASRMRRLGECFGQINEISKGNPQTATLGHMSLNTRCKQCLRRHFIRMLPRHYTSFIPEAQQLVGTSSYTIIPVKKIQFFYALLPDAVTQRLHKSMPNWITTVLTHCCLRKSH